MTAVKIDARRFIFGYDTEYDDAPIKIAVDGVYGNIISVEESFGVAKSNKVCITFSKNYYNLITNIWDEAQIRVEVSSFFSFLLNEEMKDHRDYREKYFSRKLPNWYRNFWKEPPESFVRLIGELKIRYQEVQARSKREFIKYLKNSIVPYNLTEEDLVRAYRESLIERVLS